MLKVIHCVSLMIFMVFPLFIFGLDEHTADDNGDGKPDQWIYMEKGIVLKVETDFNFDGIVDCIVEYDETGKRILEQYDYNYDGRMDNYYYFQNGLLVRQEIDSNYDDKIDIWLYLAEGKYVKQLKQDINFDGIVDIVKTY